jgi:hypothetical protein
VIVEGVIQTDEGVSGPGIDHSLKRSVLHMFFILTERCFLSMGRCLSSRLFSRLSSRTPSTMVDLTS